MMRKLTMLTGSLLLAGCSYNAAVESAADAEMAPLSGAEAYEQYCADCHSTGKDGAPVVGVHKDWADRSKLWQAVMMDHARTGYFDMPAKGGRPELPNSSIDAAVEYMLELTYEGIPPDE